jgi:hypothetical protein
LMLLWIFFWKMHQETGQLEMPTIGLLDYGVTFVLIALLMGILVYISLVFSLSAFVI